MKYQIADVFTKKEYECAKCKGKIYYAKLADESGKLITTDGLEPNGRYGKDSNVLSGAVDVLVKDRFHACLKHYIDEAIQKLNEPKPEPKKLNDIEKSLVERYEKDAYDIAVNKIAMLSGVRKACKEYNILEPAVQGMIFNAVDRVLEHG